MLVLPFVIGDTPAIAKEIAIPVFAPTDAAVVHLDRTIRAFHIIVGARKSSKVVTLNKPWPQMRKHFQEMTKTETLVVGSFLPRNLARKAL